MVRSIIFLWILNLGLVTGLYCGASLMAQMVKNLPAIQETQVQSLGQEDPLEEEMATHSSILAWRIPWTEEPNGQQSMEFQRVGYVWWLTLFIGLYYIFLNKGHKEKPENLTELWGLSSLGSLGRFCLHYYLKSQIICWILRERWLRISHCTRRQLQNLQKEIHRAMSELSKIKKDSQLSLV